MTKNVQYLYLGENGSILSPVKLVEILYVKKYKLIADTNFQLTKDGINFCILNKEKNIFFIQNKFRKEGI